MINTAAFYKHLSAKDVNFYTGVPDSLLKDISTFISDNVPKDNHIIAANEGASVGLAVGYHLATGKLPLVYMQNSGFGNAMNPILSIADEDVYGIPMLLMIGWRGEPGLKDEPQHIKQGKVSEDLLKVMKIPYEILDKNSNITLVLDKAINIASEGSKPYALLVRKNTFEKYKSKQIEASVYELNREGAVKLIIDSLDKKDIVVSTTGKTSREVFEYRESLNQNHENDFLTVGAMGHTSSIAIGIAIEKQTQNVYCLDGDGSVIMHMGSLAIIGMMKSIENFKHIIINNGAHDSVGGQPTVGLNINLPEIAKASGYTYAETACTTEEIKEKLISLSSHKGRAFLEIKVNKGARKDLGRPTTTPKENKSAYQKFLKR